MSSGPDVVFPAEPRVWKFERVDGSHVYAVSEDVVRDESGFIVRGERIGDCPYQVWTDPEFADVAGPGR